MRKLSKESFVAKANNIFENKYDYSKVNYVNSSTLVDIICPIHGMFKKTPNHHLNGQGCPICAKIARVEKKTLSNEEFIEKARKVHGDKYDYSKTNYTGRRKLVTIICPIHGEFKQIANNHLQGEGCPICGKEKVANDKRISFEEFAKKAKDVHGDKYEFDKNSFVKSKVKMTVYCKKCGNSFRITPNDILSGYGCPKCNSSHLENEIRLLLKDNNIEFEEQKRFDWLGKQSLDFYIPNKDIAIECQGEQHYIPIKWFGGKDNFDAQITRDKRKKELCTENGIKVLYYSNKKWDDNVITNKYDLVKEI